MYQSRGARPSKGGRKRCTQPAKLSRAGIRRLARRAGVLRVSQHTYSHVEEALRWFIRNVVHDASIYCQHAKRITVMPVDIARALKRSGFCLYGIDAADPVSKELSSQRRKRGRQKLAQASLSLQCSAHQNQQHGEHTQRAADEVTCAVSEDEAARIRNALSALMAVGLCCSVASLEKAISNDGSGRPPPARSTLNAALSSLESQSIIFRSGSEIYLLC